MIPLVLVAVKIKHRSPELKPFHPLHEGEDDAIFSSPPGTTVTDLVGGHEKEHRSVEAHAHFLLSNPLLHQPHFF